MDWQKDGGQKRRFIFLPHIFLSLFSAYLEPKPRLRVDRRIPIESIRLELELDPGMVFHQPVRGV